MTLVVLIAAGAPAAASALTDSASNSAAPTLWIPVIAAAVGGVAGFLASLVKEYVVHLWSDKRGRELAEQDVIKNYLAPLAASSERLLWRLAEIFVDHRHQWLKTDALPFEYNEYKRISTLYRIATLLGWVRARSLELSRLPSPGRADDAPESPAIFEVQSALADGPHVEIHRLKRIAELWNFDLSRAPNVQVLAIQFEVKLYSEAGVQLREGCEEWFSHMSDAERLRVCRVLSDFLATSLKQKQISDDVLRESVSSACEALTYKEAWIYRDWQDAIGDAVLEYDPDSVRRYRIIGYDKFQRLLTDKPRPLWFATLEKAITNVDFEMLDSSDFRNRELLDLAKAVASLVVALSKAGKGNLVSSDILDRAARIQQLV